jgi:lysophospholipase L1-like esterase
MHWPLLLPNIRRGDFVLMQFGHNDLGDPADPTRARASLSGIGDESKLIHNPITGKDEEVHTYGWYLRQIIVEARKAGATPIVCSPVPRNNWIGNKVKQAEPVLWAKQVAADEHASFIDLNADVARRYEELGPKSTKDLFADVTTHTTLEGAELTAASVMQDLIASGPAELRSSLISSGK